MHEAKLSEARFRRILSRTNRYQGSPTSAMKIPMHQACS